MIWVRKFFGVLLLAVAGILIVSIVVTISQASAYFTLLYLCITQSCEGDTLKNVLFGVITYFFMAFMVYYLGRRGISFLFTIKSENPETNSILDEADFSHAQESINYYKTKYGYCHVLNDRIIFANGKTIEKLSSYKEGNKIAGTLGLQLIIMCVMLWYIFTHTADGDVGKLAAPVLIVIISTVSFFSSLRNSTTPLILREKIIKVNFVKGLPFLINPHFVVWFTDHKNRKRKRIIALDGDYEKTSEALRIMQKNFNI